MQGVRNHLKRAMAEYKKVTGLDYGATTTAPAPVQVSVHISNGVLTSFLSALSLQLSKGEISLNHTHL